MTAKKVETESTYKFLRPLVGNVPPKKRPSVIGSLPLWAELDDVARRVRLGQLNPHEIGYTIDLDALAEFLKDENGRPLKQAKQSVLARIRAWVRANKLVSSVDQITRGNTVFIVGR